MSEERERAVRGLSAALFGAERAGHPNELLATDAILELFEMADLGVLVVDTENHIVYRNQRGEELIGLPSPFLDTQPSLEEATRIWAEREGFDATETARLLAVADSRVQAARVIPSCGRFLSAQSLPLPSGGLVLLYIDVTETERLRRKTAEDARLLATILEAAPCFIAYLDRAGRFVFANRMYAEQFDLPLERIIGRDFSELLDPEVAKERAPLLERCLSGETVFFSGTGPVPAKHIKEVHGIFAPVKGQSGEVVGAVVVLVDDTEHRALERELEAKNRELAAANAELKRLATTDSLSGALNRGSILAALDEEIKKAARYRHGLSIVLFDMDHFKLVNDLHGHAAGDEVIRRFAEVCRRSFRETDSFGRYGGEEFLAVLPESDERGAFDAAERARAAMAAERFAPPPGAPSGAPPDAGEYAATVSAGVASWEDGLDADMLLARADAALYRAKARGRNRVETQSGSGPRKNGECADAR